MLGIGTSISVPKQGSHGSKGMKFTNFHKPFKQKFTNFYKLFEQKFTNFYTLFKQKFTNSDFQAKTPEFSQTSKTKIFLKLEMETKIEIIQIRTSLYNS